MTLVGAVPLIFPRTRLRLQREDACGEGVVALELHRTQEPPSYPVSFRPGSSERRPWTRDQEAVSRRVPHQPGLQEVLTHLSPAPVPRVKPWTAAAHPPAPTHRSVTFPSLPVRSQPVV